MRKPLKIILIILALLAFSLAGLSFFSRRAGEVVYYGPELKKPLVIAHQGGDGLWPGNTLYAFQRAAEMGVDVIETDLRQTKDGVLIISHDERVDRISNGSGRVVDLTFAELQKLDAGYNWSPDQGKTYPYRGRGITYVSLAEAFKALPKMRFNIDMKQTEPSIAEVFCNLIRQHNMQNRVMAASFHHQNTTRFRQLCPEVASSADQTETTVFVFLNFAYLGRTFSPDFKAFQVPIESSGIPVITPSFVQAAHERNLWVDAWTIDDPAEMKRLIEMGVDGIISDRPDLLMKVVGR